MEVKAAPSTKARKDEKNKERSDLKKFERASECNEEAKQLSKL